MGKEIYLPAGQLQQALAMATKTHLVPAAMLTSHHCPFCIALKIEQLTPRMRSALTPGLIVIEFDVDDPTPLTLPNGSRLPARAWGQRFGLRLTPTLVILDPAAQPVGKPLVGYASRDFYGAYLEDYIQSANSLWQKHRLKAGLPIG